MVKDREYFLDLPLDGVPQHIKASPDVRATDELWGDMLTAIWWRSQSAPVPIDQLCLAVGEPDEISPLNNTDESWTYRWLGKHGPDTYSSATPFHVRDGTVIGIIQRNGDG